MILETFSVPIASSGKLDASTLPRFERHNEEKNGSGKPKDGTEIFIHNTWKKILKMNLVDTQENFFDIGGYV